MRKLALTVFVLAMLVTTFVFPVFSQERHNGLALNDENYSDWRRHILPSDEELAFLSLPWQRTFADGIIEADRVGKPVLLWTMNGHPLGCT